METKKKLFQKLEGHAWVGGFEEWVGVILPLGAGGANPTLVEHLVGHNFNEFQQFSKISKINPYDSVQTPRKQPFGLL